ncbi:MAG: methyltransferase domain-containing protein [Paracoccaceae bacterium]
MTMDPYPLSKTQHRVQQSFQRGFRKYNENAYVQKQIAARLVDLFTQNTSTPHFHSALEIGCGTGFLTQELVQQLSVDRWSINDLLSDSKDLIAPLLNASTWDFLPGAIETKELAGNYDLIASASTLQWIADTAGLLQKLSDNLVPGGWLALSSFGPKHFHELNMFDNNSHSMSYFNCTDWRSLLPKSLVPKYIGQDIHLAKFNTVQKLLMHLRNTGVNANTGHQWSRQSLATFEQEYTHRFSDQDQKVCLTYNPVYIIAQKL